MEKSKVFFAKNINEIIDKIDFSKLKGNVGIKVHFGEAGCTTYINPNYVKIIYDKIISLGFTASLIECNVLYKGSRTNASSHIRTALDHGFNFAPIDILDGEESKDFVEIDGCKIGGGIKKYDSIFVLSHFKGHVFTGFGGALKNVGMGLGSRAGKLDMHCSVKPSIKKEKCISCGLCINKCDVCAIAFDENRKANIDSDKCIGCAMCIAVCPNNAVSVPWESKNDGELQKRIVDYTKAIINNKNQNLVYLNVLENITANCDCEGKSQKTVINDIGFLTSSNIVAVEQASLDLANECGFKEINKNIDKEIQIKYAKESGLGNDEYELIKI